jgi:aldehyde dehydrogenase (NAD+)
MPGINKTPEMKFTELEIEDICRAQRDFFATGITRSYAFRKGQLMVLKKALQRNENELISALKKDLGKSAFESYGTEIGVVHEEINHAIKHLREWMQPKRVGSPLVLFGSTSKIYPQPLGCTLVISPWNYPVYLLLAPLVSAIAGGNTVILKPSEIALETEMVINRMISETYEPEYIATINGDGPVVSRLIENHHFDHIFFTGSTTVGRKVMVAAAAQLSPVTLELGGKSPCIVASDASLDYAAKKIAWSKWINAGQTCVAPDYLLVHTSIKDELVAKIAAATTAMFGPDPQQSPDYPRIINKKRWDKVAAYLQEGEIVFGGAADRDDLYIGPAIIENISGDSPLLSEEIFGPVLPVLTYQTKEEAVQVVDRNPYPLSCYVYTGTKSIADYYIENIRFGGGCINNGLVHLGNPNLPFGGVGYSGMGSCHGKSGYDTFTHRKGIVQSSRWLDSFLFYAPFKDHIRYIKKILR